VFVFIHAGRKTALTVVAVAHSQLINVDAMQTGSAFYALASIFWLLIGFCSVA